MAGMVPGQVTAIGLGDVARLGPALAVVAHPDDESFGRDAVLAGRVAEGTDVRVLCFAHGEASTMGAADDLGQIREASWPGVAQRLGITEVHLQSFPDGVSQPVRANVTRIRLQTLHLTRRYRGRDQSAA